MGWSVPHFVGLRQGWLTAVLVVGAGAALSVILFTSIRHLENHRIDADFTGRCTQITSVFQVTIQRRLDVVDSLAAFYAASDEVRRDEFRNFAAAIRSQSQVIHNLEWVPRVPDAERDAYVAAAQADGYPHFQITELAADGTLVPASRRPEYFPVYFVEPYDGNERALGFDLACDASRSAAMKRARDTGRTAATEPLTLVQSQGEKAGFLLFRPIYSSSHGPPRPEQLTGYLLAVFRVGEIIGDARPSLRHDEIKVHLYDVSDPNAPTTLYAADSQSEPHLSWPAFETRIDVAGREWLLRYRPTTHYLARQRSGKDWTALWFGLSFVALLCVVLAGAGFYTRKIERSEVNLKAALQETRRAQDETDLHDGVMQKINEGTGLRQVLDYVFESFDAIIPYDRIGCAMIRDSDRCVYGYWAKSRSGSLKLDHHYSSPLAGSSLLSVAKSGTPRIVGDLQAYYRDHPQSKSTRLLLEEGMRSNLTCPLTAMGKAVGFLFFSSAKSDTYGTAHVQTFMRIANKLSLVVQKGHLHDEMGDELRQSEERFALAVDGTDAGIWDWDVTINSVYFSSRWKSMLGYRDDEIGSSFQEWERRLHPADRERALQTINAYLEGRTTSYELEHRLRHKNGSYRWIIARGAALRDADGKPRRMVGSHIDVTERKAAEETIRQSHAHWLAAQKVQAHLLPDAPPLIPGLDIAGACFPCHFTAGDYYDFLRLSDGSLVLVIADVMGHGFGPALVAATIRTYLRSVEDSAMELADVAAGLNQLLFRSTEEERFVTLILAQLDLNTLRLQYVNAGHPAGYILDACGDLKATLSSDFPPMGLEAAASYPLGDFVALAPGDLLVLMTDGFLETLSPADFQFGAGRALEVIRKHRSRSARDLVSAIRLATTDFAAHSEQADDLTAVVMKLEAEVVLPTRSMETAPVPEAVLCGEPNAEIRSV